MLSELRGLSTGLAGISLERTSTISGETQTIQLRTSKSGSGIFDFIQQRKHNVMFVLISSRNFKKECPSGILDKGKVHKIYKQKLLPHSDSKFLVDQLFRIIDDDNNGGIDFRVSQRTLPSD